VRPLKNKNVYGGIHIVRDLLRKRYHKTPDQPYTYTAVYDAYTVVLKSNMAGICRYLVRDLRDESGQPVCDHIWITPVFDHAGLRLWKGDHIRFSAVVRRYARKNGSVDYALNALMMEKMPTPLAVA
jgi:hypothetical protein